MTLGTGENKKVNKIQKGSSEHLQLTEEAKCMYNQIADWLSELMERGGDTGVEKKEREVMHNCPQGASVMGPLRASIIAVIFPAIFISWVYVIHPLTPFRSCSNVTIQGGPSLNIPIYNFYLPTYLSSILNFSHSVYQHITTYILCIYFVHCLFFSLEHRLCEGRYAFLLFPIMETNQRKVSHILGPNNKDI